MTSQMNSSGYGRAFDMAANELERDLTVRAELDIRIRDRREAIVALSNMLEKGDSKRHGRFERLVAALPAASVKLSDVYGT